MSQLRTVEPTEAIPPREGAADPLTPAQVGSWRTQGFALVDGLLPVGLIECLQSDAIARFPAAGSPESEAITDFGSTGAMEFPSESAAMNALTLHPRLLRAIAQLLGVDTQELRLSQSDVWPKYGRNERSGGDCDNADQRIHVDYPNHTLTHPPPWDAPEAVEGILYLSNVGDCAGATALVPRTGADDPAYPWPIVNTPGVGELRWINDRKTAEEHLQRVAPQIAKWRAEHLYAREVHAHYRVGTALLYRHDLWHRGTPLLPGTLRLAQNLTFRKAESEWISTLQAGPAWSMYRRSQITERLIATVTVEQRCVLGFPKPGSPYWTTETIAAVEARYAAFDIDMSPYRQ